MQRVLEDNAVHTEHQGLVFETEREREMWPTVVYGVITEYISPGEHIFKLDFLQSYYGARDTETSVVVEISIFVDRKASRLSRTLRLKKVTTRGDAI